MEIPPPQPASPPSPQALPQTPRSSGCGCFAIGCMSFLGIGFLALIVCLVGAWFCYVKGIDMFTAPRPADIAVTMPSDAEYEEADGKLNRLRNSIRFNQAATIAFTAADLNALIARNPDFAANKGRMRIAIADSIATLEMSLSLDSLPFPNLKHRWFNGSTRLGFAYDENGFTFDPQWIDANGHHLTGAFLRSFAASFGRSFTRSFEDAVEKDRSSPFWKNVKSMTLEGDQLIVITRGPAGTTI